MEWILDHDRGQVIETVHYVNAVTLRRPAAEIFGFVTTPGRWPDYHPVSRRVEPEDDLSYWEGRRFWPAALGPPQIQPWKMDRPASLRAACRELVGAGPLERWFHWVCIECDPPRSVKLLGRAEEWGEVWATVAYRLTPAADPGATRFHRTVGVYEQTALLRALGVLGLSRLFARKWTEAMENLKIIIEEGASGPGGSE